jgi:peptidoglycan/LPS O-acetylase OafA/YrhL
MPRLVGFEAVRGLAALMVVLSHLVLGFWPELIYREGLQWETTPYLVQLLVRTPLSKVWDGGLAVTIFFVLSGFVLSVSYFQSRSTASLGSSAIRRYPRLMIPVAASILLTFVLMKTGAICARSAARFIHESRGLVYDANAKLEVTHDFFSYWYNFPPNILTALYQGTWSAFTGPAPTYNVVLWTMPVELVGSYLVYGFLALFGGMRLRGLLYVVVGAVLFARDASTPAPGTYGLIDFVLGMALCDLWIRNRRTWRWRLSLRAALVLIIVGLFAVKVKPLAAALIIGATAASPALQDWLSTRWLAMLGRLSFGIYLLHTMMLCSVGCGTYLLLCRNLGWPHAAGALAASALTLLATLTGAGAFYHAVDRPAIALARRLDVWFAADGNSQQNPSNPAQAPAAGTRAA